MIGNRRQRCRGSAMIEVALVTVVLAGAFTATFQYGYTAWVYNNLHTAVSNAARYASLRPPASENGRQPSASYLSDVRNMAVFGNARGTGNPAAPGLGPANVAVDIAWSAGAPASVTVSLRGYALDAAFRKFAFEGRPSVTYPFTLPAAPAAQGALSRGR